jgi:S1-C subfamily serine protease
MADQARQSSHGTGPSAEGSSSMNWVDYLLLVMVAVSGIHGLRLGAASQVLSFGGFWLGLFLGALVAPPLVGLAKGRDARSIIAMVVVFGAAFLLGGVGRLFGARSASALRRVRLGAVDAAAGVAVAVVATLVAAWLVGSFLANSRFTTLDAAVDKSHILHAMDNILPPVPSVFARVESFLDSEGFPIVFSGLPPEAAPPVSLPTNPAVRAAVLKAQRSTVQIVGAGCGVIQEGSGFVVAPGLVVTNAHVVAGITHPVVIDGVGQHHAVTVLLFDPRLDLSVLRVPGLDEPALPVDTTTVARGTSGVVLGYPEGGPFDYKPAAVAASFQATGLDIYGKTQTLRQVYQIDALVQPGNSGGPLISSGDAAAHIADGTVIGVVFARSTINTDVGYALAMTAVKADVDRVATSSKAVGTGACITD